jgi:hypothetical protein
VRQAPRAAPRGSPSPYDSVWTRRWIGASAKSLKKPGTAQIVIIAGPTITAEPAMSFKGGT